jgi:hypothetical protein
MVRESAAKMVESRNISCFQVLPTLSRLQKQHQKDQKGAGDLKNKQLELY